VIVMIVGSSTAHVRTLGSLSGFAARAALASLVALTACASTTPEEASPLDDGVRDPASVGPEIADGQGAPVDDGDGDGDEELGTVSSAATASPLDSLLPGTKSAWTMTFRDEFDATTLDRTKWSTTLAWGDRSLSGNKELQCYGDGNFEHRSGTLRIVARKQSRACPKPAFQAPYTSGVIASFGKFSQQYGYFELRAKVPKGKGLWPAFWLLPEDKSWPPELDVFEVVNDGKTIHQTSHWKSATGTHQQSHSSTSSRRRRPRTTSTGSAGGRASSSGTSTARRRSASPPAFRRSRCTSSPTWRWVGAGRATPTRRPPSRPCSRSRGSAPTAAPTGASAAADTRRDETRRDETRRDETRRDEAWRVDVARARSSRGGGGWRKVGPLENSGATKPILVDGFGDDAARGSAGACGKCRRGAYEACRARFTGERLRDVIVVARTLRGGAGEA